MNKMMDDYIEGTYDLFGVAIDTPQSTETDTPPSPNTPPSSVTTLPQSIEPSPPLPPSSATVAATASPMAPPKRKLSGKIDTYA